MGRQGSPSLSAFATRRGQIRHLRAFLTAATVLAWVVLPLPVTCSGSDSAEESQMHITTDRKQLIFSPAEQFSFELEPKLTEVAPGTTLDIRTTLSPARRDETIWTNEQRVAVPVDGRFKITMNVPLPRTEGVYTLRVSALRPSGFRVGFFPGSPPPLAERRVELVVFDPADRQRSSSPGGKLGETATWESVLEIDPTSARWWERLPTWTQIRRISGFNRGPLGSIRPGTVAMSSGRFIELPATVPATEPHWQAYSLPLEAVGVPHLLEIEYPTDAEQHFGISIIEPNTTGVVTSIGRSSGVFVEGFGRVETRTPQTHRMIFWPCSQAPLLVITNWHPTAAAHFGRIRVLKHTGSSSSTATLPLPSRRLIAAYLARPRVTELFGVPANVGSASNPVAATSPAGEYWQAYYDTATRMVEYLRYSGYNSAIISAWADGLSLYPSSLLRISPSQSASERWLEGSESDGLELLFRAFDREQLALLPALQFATPLPELETLRRDSDPHTSGLEWIGADGRTWLATYGVGNGTAPYYNLLEPRVQNAMLRIVNELTERYGHHPSFKGIVIQLSASGYAQLPPLEWGFDDATISRFTQDTGISISATGPQRFAARHAALTQQNSEAWRNWRAERLADFYGRLSRVLRESSGDRRLILTTEESLEHPRLLARVRPALGMESRVELTLLDLGIDRHRLESVPGLILCPTRYVGPTTPLSACAVDLEINEATARWHRADPARPAGSSPIADISKAPPDETRHSASVLLCHRPKRRRIPLFDTKVPFMLANEAVLATQPLAHGDTVRRPYLEALLDHDPVVLVDGGQLLPLGQENLLRHVRVILQQLPTAANVKEIAIQPVVFRCYAESDGVTLVVLNASPWPAEAELLVEVSQPTVLEPLSGSVNKKGTIWPDSLAPGKQPLTLSLVPYAIEAVRIPSSGATASLVWAEVSKSAKEELSGKLADLANRDLNAPHEYRALTNPSFEPLADGPLSGWRLLSDAGVATAELDADSPQHGKTSLHFRSTGEFAAVESDWFVMPPTGQMAMAVFLRGQNLGPTSSLRIVFESNQSGYIYRRIAPLSRKLSSEWLKDPYYVFLNDLPLEAESQMRVRFELSGPGEIWIDNVTLHDLLFPHKWYEKARSEIVQLLQVLHAAKAAYESNRLTDCVRILEGYWPRFVASYTPAMKPAVAVQPVVQPAPTSQSPTEQKPKTTPGVSDRLKWIVPFLR